MAFKKTPTPRRDTFPVGVSRHVRERIEAKWKLRIIILFSFVWDGFLIPRAPFFVKHSQRGIKMHDDDKGGEALAAAAAAATSCYWASHLRLASKLERNSNEQPVRSSSCPITNNIDLVLSMTTATFAIPQTHPNHSTAHNMLQTQ